MGGGLGCSRDTRGSFAQVWRARARCILPEDADAWEPSMNQHRVEYAGKKPQSEALAVGVCGLQPRVAENHDGQAQRFVGNARSSSAQGSVGRRTLPTLP